MNTKFFICSSVGDLGKINPGKAAPKVIEIWFANTVKKITPGMFAGVNQFTDTLIAEFSTNKFPKAAKNDPIKQ